VTDSVPEADLERYDAELVRLIAERGELARRLATERVRRGAPRCDLSGEAATVARFRRLGPVGGELGVLLLRLARTACGMNPPVDLSR
jgi:chorismate mutase